MVCQPAVDSNLAVAYSCYVGCINPTIFRNSFIFSGRKEKNDPNLGDRNWVYHNVVAPNLVGHIVVDPNILDDDLLHFIALVHCELNKIRTTNTGTSNCTFQGRSLAVKVNTVLPVGNSTTVCIRNLTVIS